MASGGWHHYNQQDGGKELEIYLKELNKIYAELPSLQAMSEEAIKKGIAGKREEELNILYDLARHSERFLGKFRELNPQKRQLKEIHEKLLKVNDLTHEGLLMRVEILKKIVEQGKTEQELQPEIDAFWAKQREAARAFDEFEAALKEYASKFDLEPSNYLTNLYYIKGQKQ